MFKEMLKKLIVHHELEREEAYECMTQILSGVVSPAQLSSFISILSYRGVSTEELIGLIQAMRAHSLPLVLEQDYEPIVDTCGTGAGGLKTFNVSTASALVASASGIKVAKHGNRAVTSQTGSADVLQELGVTVDLTPSDIKAALKQHSMCFMFAPIYHQALKYAATTRQEIGFRSIFNLLGPLTNPAGAKYQVIGVFDRQYSKKMAEALKELGSKHVLIVHGADGLDECTLATETFVTELLDGCIREYRLIPEEVGLRRTSMRDLQVQSSAQSAQLILDVLRGERQDEAKDLICFNAGAALYVGQKAPTIVAGVEMAKALIDSGRAFKHYLALVSDSKEVRHA